LNDARASHPIARITFNPETSCYGFAINFPGHPIHHRIDTFESVEQALRWVDPWQERVWEEASDADESSVLISWEKKAGAF